MLRVYPRNCLSVIRVQQRINRLSMDLKVRSLSPRAKKMLEKQVNLLRSQLR
jgi:hypothetical protein